MSKRNSRLRGIVVMADNQEQAQEHFRAVASGTYRVMESKDGSFAIATTDADMAMLNPVDGEEMVIVPEAEKHDLVAVASAEDDLDAYYQACASGCGVHVIADSPELLDKCPACASALPTMEADDLSKKNLPKNEVLIAVATDRKSAAEAFRALASGACETFAAQCDDRVVLSNQPINFDVYKGMPVEPLENYVPQMAEASDGEKPQLAVAASIPYVIADTGKKHMEVVYLTTASDDGQDVQHVVCSSVHPIFCPVTGVGMIDPDEDMTAEQRATASADFAALASDDEEDEEDETDEDEDDFDDEEDDEDEEEEEDDEDDEDDEEEEDDEDLSLGLASAQKPRKGGVVRKVKKDQVATASAQAPAPAAAAPAAPAVEQPVEKEMVEVQASFVSIAASEMKDSNIDVNYVGKVQGESTWMVMHNGVPFAKATASNAENPAEFASENFGRVFRAIAADQGVQAALTQLRFEELKPTLQIDQVVAEQIQTQVAEQGAALAEAASRDTSELATSYEAALATAATGITVGYFRGVENPIITALASTMEALGIDGGEELVQRAFVEHSPAYHKAILAKANDIMKFEQTVRNQIATAVADIEPKNVAVASSLSVAPVGRPVQVQRQTQTEQLATASSRSEQPGKPSFAEKLNKHRFF